MPTETLSVSALRDGAVLRLANTRRKTATQNVPSSKFQVPGFGFGLRAPSTWFRNFWY